MCDSIRLPASPCRSNPKPPPPPPSLHSFPRQSSSFSSSSNQRFRNPRSSFSAKLQVRALTASTSNGPSLDPDSSSSSPVSVDLSPICTESHFDQVVSDGPVIIMWTASWCRKCIYLKPKMEKLAAEYFPRMQFYCVDVNKVPHKLVARAAVTKMPTVQLWRDGKKQDEVIGGDKAHLIVNDVREMIDNDSEI